MTRGIVTLYELDVEICKNEGVDQFENLMLGPFLRHPAVTRYFFLPPDCQKPVKIITEKVITYLGEILDEPNRCHPVMLDELLTYIAKKKKVDRVEKLGVRIKDLGCVQMLIVLFFSCYHNLVYYFVLILKQYYIFFAVPLKGIFVRSEEENKQFFRK